MKRRTIASVLLLISLLCGCGKADAPAEPINLQAFYDGLTERYELAAMDAADDTLLESFYPGLSSLPLRQRVAYLPLITAVVSELVFLECETAEAADRAAEILRGRVKVQADGGAWYPESMAAWTKAQVITEGNYVAMIAAQEDTEAIAADFRALF